MQIFEVDLHYHAGQERTELRSLRDHLVHARATRRKILGLTDHFGLYRIRPDKDRGRRFNYPNTPDGFIRYHGELDELRPDFPDINILFAPEMSPNDNFAFLTDDLLQIIDYVICEPSGCLDSIADNTAAVRGRIADISKFSLNSGKPAFLAHPFRSTLNNMFARKSPDENRLSINPRASFRDFSLREVSDFFLIDCEALAYASAEHKIPIEVNGESQQRSRVTNNPAVIQMIWQAYALMHEMGAELVPSSDQHDFNTGKFGCFVPADCFAALGITVKDIPFIRQWL